MFLKNKTKIIQIAVLIIFTIILRLPSFFLSHNNNDELIHLSLAIKLEKYGLDVFKLQQYNLFYVERGFNPRSYLIGVLLGNEENGSLIKGFLGERERLSHHPPALPFFIAISHKIFSNIPFYLVNYPSNIYVMIRNFRIQFYACIIPFLFSLLFILSVYFLGNLFFSHRIGLSSAFILSLTPKELITANKIWADDMTAFFVVLSIIFYLYALNKNKPVFSLLSGFGCGISILSKMSGVYIVFVILLFHLFEHRNKKVNVRNLLNFFFDKNILYFLSGVFIVSSWWFDLYYLNFDIRWTKSYFMIKEMWEPARTWNKYFNIVSNRPWFSYFILVPFQTPFYSLCYIFIPIFILRKRIKTIFQVIDKDSRYLHFFIIWILVTFTFLTLKPGKELRYMLIAYPAISILSTYCFYLSYEWIRIKNFGISLRLQRIIFISIILASVAFSLKIALPRIFFRADIIPIPL